MCIFVSLAKICIWKYYNYKPYIINNFKLFQTNRCLCSDFVEDCSPRLFTIHRCLPSYIVSIQWCFCSVSKGRGFPGYTRWNKVHVLKLYKLRCYSVLGFFSEIEVSSDKIHIKSTFPQSMTVFLTKQILAAYEVFNFPWSKFYLLG